MKKTLKVMLIVSNLLPFTFWKTIYPLNNLETLGNFSTKRMPILAESRENNQTVWDPEVPLVIEIQTFIKLERRVKTHQQLSKDIRCFSNITVS